MPKPTIPTPPTTGNSTWITEACGAGGSAGGAPIRLGSPGTAGGGGGGRRRDSHRLARHGGRVGAWRPVEGEAVRGHRLMPAYHVSARLMPRRRRGSHLDDDWEQHRAALEALVDELREVVVQEGLQ